MSNLHREYSVKSVQNFSLGLRNRGEAVEAQAFVNNCLESDTPDQIVTYLHRRYKENDRIERFLFSHHKLTKFPVSHLSYTHHAFQYKVDQGAGDQK